MPTRFLKKRSIVINAGGSDGWSAGELLMQNGERSDIADNVVLLCRAKVIAAAATLTGLSDANISALLAAASADIQTSMSGVKAHPIDDLSFAMLERVQNRLADEALEGKADTSTGLKMALLEGANYLVFRVMASLNPKRAIPELALCGGLGAAQLADSQLMVKVGANPLSAGFTLENIQVTPEVECRVGNGSHFGVPVSVVTDASSGTKDIKLERGLTLFVDDENKPLATTDIGTVDVTVGGTKVEDDETPANIHRRFSRNAGTTSVSRGVSATVTPLYEPTPGPIATWPTGPVEVDQSTDVKYDLSYALFRVASEKAKHKDLQESSRKAKGRAVKAVSNYLVNRIQLPSMVWVPFLGETHFDEVEDARQFNTLPGLVSTNGSAPEPQIPDGILNSYAARYAAELRSGDAQRARNTLMELLIAFPGVLESEDGFDGEKGTVAAKVERQLRERAGL